MNRKEWNKLCKVDKRAAHYWYNIVKFKLLSKEFESLENCDIGAKVIHHLRDTEEQRKYNDEHYELFGMNLDGTFEYGKYVVFWTKEHHNEYHHCSEETKKKISDSLKGRSKSEEWRKKISESEKGKIISDEQRKQISESVKNYYTLEGSREKTSKATKEAMQRSDVRQRLINGCKKRPPISKEARQRAAEANKAKLVSNEDVSKFIKYFIDDVHISKSLSVKELSHIFSLYKESHDISWNTFQKLYKSVKYILLQKETI